METNKTAKRWVNIELTFIRLLQQQLQINTYVAQSMLDVLTSTVLPTRQLEQLYEVICQCCDHHFTIFWHSVVQKTINWINGEISSSIDNENNGLLQLKMKLFCWVYFTISATVTLPPGQKVTFFSVGKQHTSFRGDSCLKAARCISQHCHGNQEILFMTPQNTQTQNSWASFMEENTEYYCSD